MPTPNQPADAFVFFGATGDLAYKKIFPALQALTISPVLELAKWMERRGWFGALRD